MRGPFCQIGSHRRPSNKRRRINPTPSTPEIARPYSAIVVNTFDNAIKLLLAECDENTCREPFTPSEAVAMGRRVVELVKPDAEAAHKTGSAKGGKAKAGASYPSLRDESARTTSRASEAVGMGRKTFEKASAVYRWVAHIVDRNKADRQATAWRLSKLGWTQKEIGEQFGVVQSVVAEDIGNCHLAKIDNSLGEEWNEHSIADLSARLELPLTDAWAAALDGMADAERLEVDHVQLLGSAAAIW